MIRRFPDSFLWGAATAAYQIEGAAFENGKGLSIWDTFCHTPGHIQNGDTGDVACDHYHRWEADLDLMVDLGLQAYRYSVAWTRVLPGGRGKVNQAGLDFYRRLTDGLLKRGLTPMVTLYHWDLPQALQDAGGWASRDTAHAFAEYAQIVHDALGDRVAFWVTLNEPWCTAMLGYRDGLHAPGWHDEGAAFAATHHLLLAHGLGVQALRAAGARGQVGVALNLVSEVPASDDPLDIAATRRLDGTENRLYLDPLFHGRYPQDVLDDHRDISDFSFVQDGDLAVIATPMDFLGVNFYERHITRADPNDPQRGALFDYPGEARTAVGVGMNPEGLLDVLERLPREYTALPLYITENGMAGDDHADPEGRVRDEARVAFFDGHLRAVQDALARNVDVRGYFAWSFMDNFEWQQGFAKRYGLVYTDYLTQRRVPKKSGLWYRDVIRENALEASGEEASEVTESTP